MFPELETDQQRAFQRSLADRMTRYLAALEGQFAASVLAYSLAHILQGFDSADMVGPSRERVLLDVVDAVRMHWQTWQNEFEGR